MEANVFLIMVVDSCVAFVRSFRPQEKKLKWNERNVLIITLGDDL